MASWVSYPLFTNIVVALSVNIIIVFLFPTLPNLVKSPSHPKDVQPVLPRQVSQPIPKYQYGPEDLSPVLVGVINATNQLKWEGYCFKDSSAQLQLHEKSATVVLKLQKPDSTGCGDHFFFVTSESVQWDFFVLRGAKRVEFDWNSPSEREFGETWGVILMMLPNWPWEAGQESRAM